jgi:hypothetical protein
MIVAQGDAGLGDVYDQVAVAHRGRGLQRAVCADERVIGDAVALEVVARQVGELGDDAQGAPPALVVGGEVGQILHRRHVEPRLRHGDNEATRAVAERRQKYEQVIVILGVLGDEVVAGDANVGAAVGHLRDDVGRALEDDGRIGQRPDAPGVLSRVRAAYRQPRAFEEAPRLHLEFTLAGDRQPQDIRRAVRCTHVAYP